DENTSSVPESRREIVTTAEQCGAALLGMIDDMLAVSRLESGQMPLSISTCEVSELVRQSIASMGAMLNERELKFEFHPANATVSCDPEITRRVLVNLLS